MTRRSMPEWERRIRKVGLRLADGITQLFGSSAAVLYRPPEPTRQNESSASPVGPAHHVPRPSNAGDRLPPRERRGRD
jgi:hypothetical protein